ncbi:hypothetical protein BO70DRAFT_152365 [Aspergillus heteromorphus CBS 117.55]|uniref:Uncharacterized protein n=1 Tax=Aspergillus heteromorphus CBS 117.55 TaxID=1448321 RepID=A0A317V3S6_9EURO|nr:uncharacterized protein BO70DRAFT_152365 [Aspergillus heteromorphus CBS 117.55]PWY68676.1 hypothetical protein BO70DRAFT_152365 [Aspergillus heteromorphus CBS 117.55]
MDTDTFREIDTATLSLEWQWQRQTQRDRQRLRELSTYLGTVSRYSINQSRLSIDLGRYCVHRPVIHHTVVVGSGWSGWLVGRSGHGCITSHHITSIRRIGVLIAGVVLCLFMALLPLFFFLCFFDFPSIYLSIYFRGYQSHCRFIYLRIVSTRLSREG